MRGNKPFKQFNSDQLDAVSSICDDGYLDRQGQSKKVPVEVF